MSLLDTRRVTVRRRDGRWYVILPRFGFTERVLSFDSHAEALDRALALVEERSATAGRSLSAGLYGEVWGPWTMRGQRL